MSLVMVFVAVLGTAASDARVQIVPTAEGFSVSTRGVSAAAVLDEVARLAGIGVDYVGKRPETRIWIEANGLTSREPWAETRRAGGQLRDDHG